MTDEVSKLQTAHSTTLAKLTQYKRKHLELGHRVLEVISLNYIISFLLSFLSSQFFSLPVSYKFFSITVHWKKFFFLMFFLWKNHFLLLEINQKEPYCILIFCSKPMSKSTKKFSWYLSLEVIRWPLLLAHRYLSETRRNSVMHFQ